MRVTMIISDLKSIPGWDRNQKHLEKNSVLKVRQKKEQNSVGVHSDNYILRFSGWPGR